MRRITLHKATRSIRARIRDSKLVDTLAIDVIAEELEQALSLASERCKPLVIDLSNVAFLSSVMINKLILLQKSSKQQSVRLVLMGLNTDIREIFSITELDKVFEILAFHLRDEDDLEPSGFPIPKPDPPPKFDGTIQLDEPHPDEDWPR